MNKAATSKTTKNERRVAIEIILDETATRNGQLTRFTGSYRAIVNGEEFAVRPFDGGPRQKYYARLAIVAALGAIEELA